MLLDTEVRVFLERYYNRTAYMKASKTGIGLVKCSALGSSVVVTLLVINPLIHSQCQT